MQGPWGRVGLPDESNEARRRLTNPNPAHGLWRPIYQRTAVLHPRQRTIVVASNPPGAQKLTIARMVRPMSAADQLRIRGSRLSLRRHLSRPSQLSQLSQLSRVLARLQHCPTGHAYAASHGTRREI